MLMARILDGFLPVFRRGGKHRPVRIQPADQIPLAVAAILRVTVLRLTLQPADQIPLRVVAELAVRMVVLLLHHAADQLSLAVVAIGLMHMHREGSCELTDNLRLSLFLAADHRSLVTGFAVRMLREDAFQFPLICPL